MTCSPLTLIGARRFTRRGYRRNVAGRSSRPSQRATPMPVSLGSVMRRASPHKRSYSAQNRCFRWRVSGARFSATG